MNNNKIKKSYGSIKLDGCGGFLNPPTHPEHTHSVTGRNFFMSLSSAVDAEWLEDIVRARAKRILDAWTPLPIEHEDVQNWIYRSLGYFNNCYSKDWINRNVNTHCEIIKYKKGSLEFWKNMPRHLGVMHIREYYPQYQPKLSDFNNAYWGKKPTKEEK